ncbi:hypothetical protein MJG53_008910 [Ovis ammon polii x Ovis aries]|uniref:Uncharacterized protein n=1 Tax=Ovis ammon polii x Ovis aries TaxID=2918886 RepID=A0ACB9UXW6_9CETA|nr:hypothetical protein MJG53_008910 [Ovis ammon polii x Ovis aries]
MTLTHPVEALGMLGFDSSPPVVSKDWERHRKDCPDRFLDLKGWPVEAVIITRGERDPAPSTTLDLAPECGEIAIGTEQKALMNVNYPIESTEFLRQLAFGWEHVNQHYSVLLAISLAGIIWLFQKLHSPLKSWYLQGGLGEWPIGCREFRSWLEQSTSCRVQCFDAKSQLYLDGSSENSS